MSRKILFRGKRTDNGEWTQGYLFRIWEKAYICWGTVNGVPDMKEVDPETVGQYAGIRTYKNGRKIFEGDIIKVNDFWTGVVVWEFNDTSFEVEPNDEMEVMECLGVVVNGNKVEVIGNIFDNPQLLEGGEDN